MQKEVIINAYYFIIIYIYCIEIANIKLSLPKEDTDIMVNSNDSLEDKLNHIKMMRKLKIIPKNIKSRNFKASVEKKFLVLSNEKFVF